MFRITKEWLDSNKTKAGAYSKTQIESLNIDWPPTKGWKNTVIGLCITPKAKSAFESKSESRGFPLYMRVMAMIKKLNTADKKFIYEFLKKELTKKSID